MNQKTILSTGLVIILIAACIIGAFIFSRDKKNGAADYKNTTYTIGDTEVTLKDGVSEIEVAPGSATRIITRYFGNEAEGDLNGDGITDTVFILTQTTGGSGTFYYLAGALQGADGKYTTIPAVLIGDRIAPQTVEIHKDENALIVVNYADRAPGENFTTTPSMQKTLRLRLDAQNIQFKPIMNNEDDYINVGGNSFEVERNPWNMTILNRKFTWQSVVYKNGTSIAPKKVGAFTLTFAEADPKTKIGRFTATTDCNSGFGSYALEETGGSSTQIIFTNIAATKMFCEGSQENIFFSLLEKSRSIIFLSNAGILLELAANEGTMVFSGVLVAR